jgi:amidohydrolase
MRNGEGRTVLLRADMDGPPIEEASGAPYASKNHGIMHAYGHEGHTATLLTVAEVLTQVCKQVSGTIKFAFQPAEELPRVDAVFGLHLWNSLTVGKIGVDEGLL